MQSVHILRRSHAPGLLQHGMVRSILHRFLKFDVQDPHLRLTVHEADAPVLEVGERNAPVIDERMQIGRVPSPGAYQRPLAWNLEGAFLPAGPAHDDLENRSQILERDVVRNQYGSVYGRFGTSQGCLELVRRHGLYERVDDKKAEGPSHPLGVYGRDGVMPPLGFSHWLLNIGEDRYLSPVSARSATMVLPAFSGLLASWMAAQTAAPDEIPTRTPSFLAI